MEDVDPMVPNVMEVVSLHETVISLSLAVAVLVVTQLVVVEESVHRIVAKSISVGTPFSLVTQLVSTVEESLQRTVAM